MARSTNRQGREARDRLRVYEARQTVHREGRSRRIRDNVVAVVGIVAVGALATVTQVFYFTAGPGAPTPSPSASAAASTVPPADLSEFRTWTGSLTIGDVAVGIELDGELAPQATAGWVQDAATGYYLDTTCHRIAADFSFLQCGSIDGLGSPDPTFQYGPIENAPADDIYPTGTIAMARVGGDASSIGHQFFIVFSDVELPADAAGGYTVVGRVTAGLEELAALVAATGIDPTLVNPDGSGQPASPLVITDLTLQ